MVAKHIQANYDCLQEAVKLFMRHADMTVALTFQIEGLVDQLQGGAWRGMGAEAFYAEMGEVILPAMRKLQDTLQFAGEGMGKIHHILRGAEEEAARLFQSLPEWDSLAEYVPPTTDDSPADEKEKLEKLKKLLEVYGITITGKWSADDLEDVYETVTQVGIRLENFAVGIYGAPVPNGAELFKLLFGKDGKLTFRRGEGQETKEGAWATNDLNGTLTFYGKAFFSGTKNIERNLQSNMFKTDFSAAFLVMHELGHSLNPVLQHLLLSGRSSLAEVARVTLEQYFRDTSLPLLDVVRKVTGLNTLEFESNPMGSIGFKFAARSDVNISEFLADAVANWIGESYTPDNHGNHRRSQMNDIMRHLFFEKMGFPTGNRAPLRVTP